MSRINPDRVVGRPGWLCEHRMSRDVCPRCREHLEDWVAVADAKEPEDMMKKQELADALKVWIAGQGIEVSDCEKDTPAFLLRLPLDGDTYQVYRIAITIPRDKSFTLSEDWHDHQEQLQEQHQDGYSAHEEDAEAYESWDYEAEDP